jgi:hypothetical protein
VKAAQQILSGPWPDRACVGDVFEVAAKATSGLPVAAVVLAGPAMIAGDRVTFLRLGEVKIKLTQDGNEEFEAAAPALVTFNVTKASQTCAIEPLPAEIFSGDRIVIKATASSLLPVSLRVVSGPAQLSGGRVAIITGPGKVEIELSQSGNDKFLASRTNVSFHVGKTSAGDPICRVAGWRV